MSVTDEKHRKQEEPDCDLDLPPGSFDDLSTLLAMADANDFGPDLETLIEEEQSKRDSLGAAQVLWSLDQQSPSYAHLGAYRQSVKPEAFSLTPAALSLLIAANRFQPAGGSFVFALRGAEMMDADALEDRRSISLLDARPDHWSFRCTIGICAPDKGLLSAYRASTVPNKFMVLAHHQGRAKANLLPEGCYVYRVGPHNSGTKSEVNPALRLSDADAPGKDGTVTVLRTGNDPQYGMNGIWDICIPNDNIHCAYYDNKFSSAGCLTIKGRNGAGPWSRFQRFLTSQGSGARIDVILLTGAEAAIAAELIADGHDASSQRALARLVRLRHGSQGDEVLALQKRLGFKGTGYFGAHTKAALVKLQQSRGLPTDGVYAPAMDGRLGWTIMGGMIKQATPRKSGAGITVGLDQLRRFASNGNEAHLASIARQADAIFGPYAINQNPRRLCHFMAQAAHECAAFRLTEESLTYTTADRLLAVHGKRISASQAGLYLRNPEKLANMVYGGRMGNVAPGDGYRYRGRGYLQITGRSLYRETGARLSLPLEENPELAADPAHALRIACEIWASRPRLQGERDMNQLADSNKIEAITFRINGWYNGIEDRAAKFREAWAIWGTGPAPETPDDPEILERGDRGARVQRLQRELTSAGFSAGADGVFGSGTANALRAFQQQMELTVDGIAGPETWAALQAPRQKPGQTSSAAPGPAYSKERLLRLAIVCGFALLLLETAVLAFIWLR